MAGKVKAVRKVPTRSPHTCQCAKHPKRSNFTRRLLGRSCACAQDSRRQSYARRAENRRFEFMIADEFPGMGTQFAQALGGSPVVLNMYVQDVDTFFKQAVAAGPGHHAPGRSVWGDRYGQISDPFGHSWALGSHVEDVAPEEMERRANAIFGRDVKKGRRVEKAGARYQ